MITMTIIGILLSVSISSFQSAQMRQRDLRRKADVLKIQTSLESYKASANVYGPDYGVKSGAAIGSCSTGGQLGGYYVTSTSTSATLDPMFVPGANTATDGSGYMLAYMQRPNYINSKASISYVNQMAQCSSATTVYIKESRIGYAVYKNQYWVYVALENKNEPRQPASTTKCYHFVAGDLPAIEFRDSVFNAYSSEGSDASCNGFYKMFARGSLTQPSQ